MRRIVLALAVVSLLGFAATPSEAALMGGRPLGSGVIGRAFMTRLYYSNAFRGTIPGTGYGGYARPAFGYPGR